MEFDNFENDAMLLTAIGLHNLILYESMAVFISIFS
jgi:hypothetical protein